MHVADLIKFITLQVESNETDNFAITFPTANISINVFVRNCSQRFALNEVTGFCSPVCGEWEEFPRKQVITFAVLITLLYILHIIGTVIAIAFSFYNYQIM